MNFIRKHFWVLFAFLALGCQPGQAMEGRDYFSKTHPPIKSLILKEVFISAKTPETNFRDIGTNLSLVCKYFKNTIGNNAKNWVCEHFNIEEKNKDDFWRYFKGKLVYKNSQVFYFKGKLIYKPNTDNDEGRVVFCFSAAPNPFKHTFNLSKCDDAGKGLSFHLGIPTEDKEVATKVQTWIFFSPDVKNKLETTAQHLKPIFPVKVPVGMLWTWGKCNDLALYNHIATDTMENLSKINIYENLLRSDAPSPSVSLTGNFMRMWQAAAYGMPVFQVLFVN